MTLYNVFDSEIEAVAAESYDFSKYIALRNDDALYKAITVRWAEVRQRFDGKYVYPVCNDSDAVYSTEEYSNDWFPIINE